MISAIGRPNMVTLSLGIGAWIWAALALGQTHIPWPQPRSPIPRDPIIESKVSALVGKMSLEEKIGQMVQAEIHEVTPEEIKQFSLGSVLNAGGSHPNKDRGASVSDWVNLADQMWSASMEPRPDRHAIPIMWGTDAVHGHNNVRGATIFPHNIGLGATRNPNLIYRIGQATALEVAVTGIDWTFAPTLAVARDSRWGRTYESYSEDPTLVKTFSYHMVSGLQGLLGPEGLLQPGRIIATAKHFIGDGGTAMGRDQGHTRISEEALRDIHAPGYEGALSAGVQTVMVSFSSWQNQKAHGNRYLITEILKEAMGFDGIVVSDWNGHGQVKGCENFRCPQAVNAGIDIFMIPYRQDWQAFIHNTVLAVRNGEIAMERIDDAVRRILRVKYRAGLFSKGKPSSRQFSHRKDLLGSPAHRQLAREAVRSSLVLLKNNNEILPISRRQRVLLAGKGADSLAMQAGGWTVTWQGTETQPEDYEGATSIRGAMANLVPALTYDPTGHSADRKNHDVAIVVIGETPYAEFEGDINGSLTLEHAKRFPEDVAVLDRIRRAGVPIVTVMLAGRPLYTNQELNRSEAFVMAFLPGSEGQGVTDVLFRNEEEQITATFTGKLSFSWPNGPCDSQSTAEAGEGRPQSLFPMGYGLTYGENTQVGPLEEVSRPDGCDPTAQVPRLTLFGEGHAFDPWQIAIADPTTDWNGIPVVEAAARLPHIHIQPVADELGRQKAARHVTFFNEAQVYLQNRNGVGQDLLEYRSLDSRIRMALRVEAAPIKPVALRIDCGFPCTSRVDITAQLTAIAGQGWQEIALPLGEFDDPRFDFTHITSPFLLESQGPLEFTFSRITWGS